MQNVDNERERTANGITVGNGNVSNNSTPTPAGCISKKWLFYILRPNATYRAQVVREFMETADRLNRCGINPDQYNSIRIFTAEATNVILSDLKQLNFL